jgi:putative membrane protein
MLLWCLRTCIGTTLHSLALMKVNAACLSFGARDCSGCEEVAMMYDWGMGWGGGMFFGLAFMIALLVLSVVLIVVLVRWFSGERTPPRDSSRTPREILDERFAKGEIDREDYDARRKALSA